MPKYVCEKCGNKWASAGSSVCPICKSERIFELAEDAEITNRKTEEEEFSTNILEKSKQKVGEVYPTVISKRTGDTIVGKHRKKAGWKKEEIVDFPNRASEILFKIHEHIRRKISFEERSKDIREYAEALEETGIPKEKILKQICEDIPFSYQYICMCLPDKYKRMEKAVHTKSDKAILSPPRTVIPIPDSQNRIKPHYPPDREETPIPSPPKPKIDLKPPIDSGKTPSEIEDEKQRLYCYTPLLEIEGIFSEKCEFKRPGGSKDCRKCSIILQCRNINKYASMELGRPGLANSLR
jgi:hypothetical protein